MKLVWTFCVLKIICSAAAPIAEEQPNLPDEDEFRDKRSSYTIPYVSPCAASSLPMVPSYHMNLPPVQNYLRPHYYNYNYPRYRSIDPNEMNLLNMDMYRSAQNAQGSIEGMPSDLNKPGITILNSHNYAQAMPNMPAVGLFPYVNPDPMHVPLLITCTPSIAQGQMVQPQMQHNIFHSDGFRNTEYEDLFERDSESQPEYLTNSEKQENVAVKPQ
ncbi:hypothetical protein RR48_14655 [Papilio machaon]|uniref:Uncharacterized protein n=1 Tax=Papilio machaon TaxID=76193 RepID=A0A194QKW5_PAPMA|nr:hypothetical protein RR48_14655 [Papilio machaon]